VNFHEPITTIQERVSTGGLTVWDADRYSISQYRGKYYLLDDDDTVLGEFVRQDTAVRLAEQLEMAASLMI
jgi:hypothetical protein